MCVRVCMIRVFVCVFSASTERTGGAHREEDLERCAILPQAPSGPQRSQAGEPVVGTPGGERRASGDDFNSSTTVPCLAGGWGVGGWAGEWVCVPYVL